MTVCAACGDQLADHSSRRIVLEIEDRTRSTRQFMGDETNIKRICLGRDLCEGCWREFHDKLA